MKEIFEKERNNIIELLNGKYPNLDFKPKHDFIHHYESNLVVIVGIDKEGKLLVKAGKEKKKFHEIGMAILSLFGFFVVVALSSVLIALVQEGLFFYLVIALGILCALGFIINYLFPKSKYQILEDNIREEVTNYLRTP